MKACEVVGVSRRTIYNWMAGGKVQYVRTAGGSVRIFADSLWRDATERRRESSGNPALPASSPRRTARVNIAKAWEMNHGSSRVLSCRSARTGIRWNRPRNFGSSFTA